MKQLNVLWLISGIALLIQGCGVAGSPLSSRTRSATAQNKLPGGSAAVPSVGADTGSTAAPTGNANTSAQLTANPLSLDFSNTTVGTNSSLPVILANSGNSTISISNVIISGPGFSANGLLAGTILSPGQSAGLNVTFAPSGAGNVSGSVTIISNAANSSAAISLAGAGVQATLSSITLLPANPTIKVGDQVQLRAVDNFGNDISSSAVWSSSDPSIVSVAGGLAKGIADGSVTITAIN